MNGSMRDNCVRAVTSKLRAWYSHYSIVYTKKDPANYSPVSYILVFLLWILSQESYSIIIIRAMQFSLFRVAAEIYSEIYFCLYDIIVRIGIKHTDAITISL